MHQRIRREIAQTITEFTEKQVAIQQKTSDLYETMRILGIAYREIMKRYNSENKK